MEYVSAQKYPLGSNQPVMLTQRVAVAHDFDPPAIETRDSKLSIYPENNQNLYTTSSHHTSVNHPLRKPLPSFASNHPPSKLHPVIQHVNLGAGNSRVSAIVGGPSMSMTANKNLCRQAVVNVGAASNYPQQSARAPLESKAAKGITSKMSEPMSRLPNNSGQPNK